MTQGLFDFNRMWSPGYLCFGEERPEITIFLHGQLARHLAISGDMIIMRVPFVTTALLSIATCTPKVGIVTNNEPINSDLVYEEVTEPCGAQKATPASV